MSPSVILNGHLCSLTPTFSFFFAAHTSNSCVYLKENYAFQLARYFFRGVALDAWRYITNPEMTRTEADFVERTLGIEAGARLLDVPCGNGRHAIELASRGYQMTGLDQSEEFIAEARSAKPLTIRWVQDDMRSISWVSEFDGAYCLGISFCYLSWDEAHRFLNAVARCLKPRARFIVDTGMAAESILPSLAWTRWFRLGDILMLSENRYDAAESRLDVDYTFVHGGEVETRPTTSYVFTAGCMRMRGFCQWSFSVRSIQNRIKSVQLG